MKLDLFELDKKTLLQYVTEEQIFCKYLEIDSIEFDRSYGNALRNDPTPGCSFFVRDSDGRVIFHDWSKAWMGDCFDVAMAAYGCKFGKIIEQIAIDFNIIPTNNKLQRVKAPNFVTKVPLTLRIRKRPMNAHELLFWNIGGFKVSESLLAANNIYVTSDVWEMRGEEIENYMNRLKMTYFYKFPGKWKYQIYRPDVTRNRRRFINSPGIQYGDLELLNDDDNYVVITKSKKDAFFLRLLGVNAFFTISETNNLDPDLLLDLRQKYEYVFTLFDNDMTGKRRSIHYKTKYGTIPLIYPKIWGKDTYDVLSYKKKAFMYELIERVKKIYYL